MSHDTSSKKKPSDDVMLLCGRDARSGEVYGLRRRGGRVEAACMRPVVEGKPLVGDGEIVKLSPHEDNGHLCDVEVLYDPPRSARDRAGPARVTSAAYRDNWDSIFGTPSGQLAN